MSLSLSSWISAFQFFLRTQGCLPFFVYGCLVLVCVCVYGEGSGLYEWVGVWREMIGLYECGMWQCGSSTPSPTRLFFSSVFVFFFCFSAGNFLSTTWALWTSIRHNQSGVNIGLRKDTHRETLTMSSCNIRETQRGRCREERERCNQLCTLN